MGLVMEGLMGPASTSTLTRSPPTPTSTMLLTTTVAQTSKPRSLMMEQQPDRDPTPWLSLMEGSSMSTTMPMMLRDMSPRLSMMELLHILRLLLAMELLVMESLVMEWLMLPLLWLMWPLLLQLLPTLLQSLLPILLLVMVLDMLLSVENHFQSMYLFMLINIIKHLK